MPKASQKRGHTQQRASSARPKPRKAATSKLDKMVAALGSAKGATIKQLAALTGWQSHSVRGAMSGALKHKRGLTIVSSKLGAERVYKIGNAQ